MFDDDVIEELDPLDEWNDESLLDDWDREDFLALEDYGDEPEAWDDESLAERRRRRRLPRYRRRYGRGRRSPVGRRRYRRQPVGKVSGGRLRRGPGGRATVRFSKPPATAESVAKIQSQLTKALAAVRADIKKVDQRLDTNTATLDKKVTAVDASVTKLRKDVTEQQNASRMSALLPLLLTSTPKLKTLTFANAPQQGANAGVTAEFEKDDNSILLIAAMGGLGGTGAGSSAMSPLLLALALKN